MKTPIDFKDIKVGMLIKVEKAPSYCFSFGVIIRTGIEGGGVFDSIWAKWAKTQERALSNHNNNREVNVSYYAQSSRRELRYFLISDKPRELSMNLFEEEI